MLARAVELKQELIDFIYDAEGELAVTLEQYAAQHGEQEHRNLQYQNLVVDRFLVEGNVSGKTPIGLFLEGNSELEPEEEKLVQSWHRTFTGLFEVLEIDSEINLEKFRLKNWLTAKHYTVWLTPEVSEAEAKRWKSGEILLTRIAPIDEENWMFSGACLTKGKLSVPKLAVAVGEFQKRYQNSLYGDAPELLEQAWESVAIYHQKFVDFFGSDHVTLPGYQLNKKLAELQQLLVQAQLEAAGIDSSKSIQELVEEAGADKEEFETAAVEAGADIKAVDQAMTGKLSNMATPKAELPDEIKKAEKVDAFSHPRWGQMFIPTYSQFVEILEGESEDQSTPEETNAGKFVTKYLEDPKINAFLWHRLQEQYPQQLESLLQSTLERPNFDLSQDLDPLLKEFDKPLEPNLPEIASIPQHLNDLFEAAVTQVNQSKSKKSSKKGKASKGFM